MYAAEDIVDVSDDVLQNEIHRRNNKRIATENSRVSTKYDVDIKRYNDGKSLLKNAELHSTAILQQLLGVTDEKEKKNIINRLKREKKWLLNDDYLSLIRYKQLSMAEKPSIPSTLAPRKLQWETRYQAMNHPCEPIPPGSYVSAPGNFVSAVPDGDEDGSDVVSLSVLSRNLDLLAALPANPVRRMNTFVLDDVENSEEMAVADILMNIQQQEV